MYKKATATGIPVFVIFWIATAIRLSVPESEVRAQPEPRIDHAPMVCVASNRFAELTAQIRPAEEIRAARVYFRALQYAEYYYVDMLREAEGFRAILPMPGPDTTKIVYYIEAVTQTFNSTRTAEILPDVLTEEDCSKKRPKGAYFPGNDPGIVVGATSAGAAIPPGFLITGIAGTITAGGVLSAGTGVGVGTLVAIGAGVGGGVGVIAAVGGDDATTTTVIASPPTTTAVTSTVPANTTLRACFETTPSPAVIPVGSSVRMDASCSEPSAAGLLNYLWDLGDGRERDTRVITPVYNSPGVFTATLIVRPTSGTGEDRTQKDVTVVAITTTTVPGGGGGGGTTTTTTPTTTVPLVPADLGVTISGPLSVAVGGSGGYAATAINNGPQPAPGVFLNFAAVSGGGIPASSVSASDPSCSPSGPGRMSCSFGTVGVAASRAVTFTVGYTVAGNYTCQAQVGGGVSDPNPANNSAAIITGVTQRTNDSLLDSSFTSWLSLSGAKAGARGHVILNGARTDDTDPSGPFTHQLRAKVGENRVEATVASEGEEGLWRFDFSGSAHFEPGTFVVELGEVLSMDAASIVFRVSGKGGRIKFRFRLRS